MNLVRSSLPTLLALLTSLGTFLGSTATSAETIAGRTMGTTYAVKLTHAASDDLKALIDKRLREIDARMSTYRDDSELSRFNQSKSGDWFAVSADTAFVAQLAVDLAQKTDGAFDPTVGPLVNLWNFGPNPDPGKFPTEQQVSQTLQRVGYQHFQVQLEPPALRKLHDDLAVDFSAIAKGFAVDALAKIVREQGFADFMVEIGGEVRTSGKSPRGTAWQIALEAPDRKQRSAQYVVPVQDRALASSGDYRNYFEHNGKFYSHTIDPRTGYPVTHRTAAVSVLADDCASADAWATALLVMGAQKGLELAKQQQLAILFMSRDGDSIVTETSSNFPTYKSATNSDETGNSNMLTYFVAATVVFGIALFGMAIGVIISNRRIQGSCGGLSGLKDEHGRTLCEACTKPSPECSGTPE